MALYGSGYNMPQEVRPYRRLRALRPSTAPCAVRSRTRTLRWHDHPNAACAWLGAATLKERQGRDRIAASYAVRSRRQMSQHARALPYDGRQKRNPRRAALIRADRHAAEAEALLRAHLHDRLHHSLLGHGYKTVLPAVAARSSNSDCARLTPSSSSACCGQSRTARFGDSR